MNKIPEYIQDIKVVQGRIAKLEKKFELTMKRIQELEDEIRIIRQESNQI